VSEELNTKLVVKLEKKSSLIEFLIIIKKSTFKSNSTLQN